MRTKPCRDKPTKQTYTAMDVNKVLYISQEITPYLAPDKLSTFGKMLPQSVQEAGIEVRTFMPRYGIINERRNQLHEVIRLSGLNIVIDDTDHPLIIKVATLQPSRMQVYFIDNDDYFQRHATEGLETETAAEENDERSIFFVRGVLETAKKLRWIPSVIHCTGWISALAPVYLKKIYAEDPAFSASKVVYSLFDAPFEGSLDKRMVEKLVMDGFKAEDLTAISSGDIDFNALNRLAIDHADAIAISSNNIAPELIEYARQSGKPLLEYPGEDNYTEAYSEFYRSL